MANFWREPVGPKKQQPIDRRLLPVRIRVLLAELPAPYPQRGFGGGVIALN